MKYLIKILLLTFFIYVSLEASLYDEEQKRDFFLDTEFKEIIRFDMISFEGDRVDANSVGVLRKIIKKIKTYTNSPNEIRISIIGHTNAITEDENEVKVESDTYAKYVCDMFTSCMTKEDSKLKSTKYASIIQKIMIKNSINGHITVVDYRSGDDLAFSDSTQEGKDLSNRVMITLYVLPNRYRNLREEIHYKDSDKDGVIDKRDRCLNTPRGSNVDAQGCSYVRDYANTQPQINQNYQPPQQRYESYNNPPPRDGDSDGVADFRDECARTPIGITVNRRGCPEDRDEDNVYDYKDRCLNSAFGVEVDMDGCAKQTSLRQRLSINFETGSNKIEYSSFIEIRKFSTFLKENQKFYVEIIGHTDNIGIASKNLILSQSRAEAIKKALIIEGIDAGRLSALGKGEMEPIKTNRTEDGRKANRRIDIKLSY
ncbi:MAG: OmpA family protein [Campylobacterota bacterium]|nr:OmpA family protein [Campylobacterota bacterium]